MKNTITVNATPRQAASALPREITIDTHRFEITPRSEHTFAVRWERKALSGAGRVVITARDGETSSLTVELTAPRDPLGMLLWPRERLQKLSLRAARAMRYEIETRTVEQTDGFSARRTTAVLVKNRA